VVLTVIVVALDLMGTGGAHLCWDEIKGNKTLHFHINSVTWLGFGSDPMYFKVENFSITFRKAVSKQISKQKAQFHSSLNC